MIKRTLFTSVFLACTAQVQAQLFDERPDVVVCSVAQSATADDWDKFVFYISGTRKDGAILYKSLTSNPVLITIDTAGNVTAPNLADCDKSTVKQLRERGQAANFSR